MKWFDRELRSPFSGKLLHSDSPHSFSDGERRFPVIDEIPFLRGNRDELIAEVLRNLDSGNEREALVLLLRDQDDWARTDPPAPSDLQPLFDNENITLREAMSCLKYGAVADYFAYRWSDPTFLSGLKLLETHLPAKTSNVFELACGIGHYLREFHKRNIQAIGVDVVFSKLWLARRFVAPQAKLIVCDANYDFPFGDGVFEASFCHDAFYFMPEKQHIADELKRTTRGAILIGHAHNANAENFSSGAAVSVTEYQSFFDKGAIYDDAELTAAFIENRQPQAQSIDELSKTEAVSLAVNTTHETKVMNFSANKSSANLRINPVLIDERGKVGTAPEYPSERYRNEYAALSGYLNLSDEEAKRLNVAPVEDLTENEIERFSRRRILLDLPEKW
jgi:stage V sporulation protein SpoVS